MSTIHVEHQPDAETLQQLGVHQWPTWSKEISQFPWFYDDTETCYILEGQVTVTTESGETVTVGPGDLVTFPRGLSCTWHITQPIRKHYRFG